MEHALEIFRAKDDELKRMAEEKAKRDDARENRRRKPMVENMSKATHMLATFGRSIPLSLKGLLVAPRF